MYVNDIDVIGIDMHDIFLRYYGTNTVIYTVWSSYNSFSKPSQKTLHSSPANVFFKT